MSDAMLPTRIFGPWLIYVIFIFYDNFTVLDTIEIAFIVRFIQFQIIINKLCIARMYFD